MTKWYRDALPTVLSLLGFSSCASSCDNFAEEYGVPTMSYQVRGSVADAETGAPIEGIQARLANVYRHAGAAGGAGARGLDSVLTDREGHFETRSVTAFPEDEHLKLIVEDVDGEQGGGFYESDTLDVARLPQTQTAKGDGSWYGGARLATADVKLKKKK